MGCLAALSGHEHINATLLESTRVLGGRVRSKAALGALAWDQGASYFTAKDPASPFAEVLRAGRADGVVERRARAASSTDRAVAVQHFRDSLSVRKGQAKGHGAPDAGHQMMGEEMEGCITRIEAMVSGDRRTQAAHGYQAQAQKAKDDAAKAAAAAA